MGLRDDQLAALRAKLSAKDVHTKVVNGFSLSYVEGWYTIAEANRIFGFDGWDRETVAAECVWHGTTQNVPAAAYIARVRVRVHSDGTPVVRDGSGFGTGTGSTPGDAHEKAIKEAETDAMKRALATFGNRFGLCLYDKEQKGLGKRGGAKPARSAEIPASGWILKGSDGQIQQTLRDPNQYYSCARKLLEDLRDPNAIRELWKKNEDALRALRIAHPDLRDQSGTHYTVLFGRLCKEQARVAEMAPAATANGRRMAMSDAVVGASAESGEPSHDDPVRKTAPPGPQATSQCDDAENDVAVNGGADPAGVDKSVLLIGAPRRIRDKEHLRAVAEQPCLICGRAPSHAHHLTFVQPRARGLKTSDEWVVPLCFLHHRQLHDRGDEQEWWRERSLDPVPFAIKCWMRRAG
jgi:DNA recombination protein Rad52